MDGEVIAFGHGDVAGVGVAAHRHARRRGRRTLAVQIGVVLAVVLLVLGAIVSLDERVARTLVELRGSADAAAVQASAAGDLLESLVDAENRQQAFLLTRQELHLEPFWSALSRLNDSVETLDRLGTHAPWLRNAAAALHGVVQEKLAELDRSMALARAGERDAALSIVLSAPSQAIMTAARAQVASVIARANEIRDDRLATLRVRERQAETAIIWITAVGLFLLGLAAAILLAGRDRLARSETALRVQSDRLAVAIAHLRDGVAVFDAADRLLIWNANFFAATGLPITLAVRGTDFSRFAAATSDWPSAPLTAPRPQSAPQAFEIASAGRTIDLWRASMPDGGQMLAAIDTTERVAADATARQASKMEALGQLTGGVAHDFNNLLQVVSSNLELLTPLLPPSDLLRRRLAAAMAGVERAAQLTRRLLAFARRQPLAPDTVDPARLLHGMEDMLRRTLGQTVLIDMAIDPDIWAIRADPQLLENALLNLAINARDAMPQGGRLTLSATNATPPADDAELTPGEYVLLAVSDTGGGMTPEILARATEPFFTTKGDGRGTGLGLSMVFGFAKQSGGNLAIESAPGRGTTARLFIPRSQGVPEVLPDPATDRRTPIGGQGETVLAVEDDPAVRSAAVQALANLGYRVVEASNAAAALALLRGGTRPDILFTDMVMPGQPSAVELAEEARALHPGIAVLFTSGLIDGGAAPREPTFLLLTKPWRIEDLGLQLRAAMLAARGTPPEHSQPYRTKRAFLVEDDVMVRTVTSDLLAELGYDVVEHATGASALEALQASGADLLLTDIGLPDMSGLDVARHAVRLEPHLAVVIASGAQETGEDEFTFLEKPYDAARLRRAVAKAREMAS